MTVQVHPQGLCESTEVGPGTRVWAFAHVLPGAVVGADCNICDHAFIESGARLGDRVTVKNAVLVWDGVTVEDDVFLGPNVLFTNDLRPRAAIRRSPQELLPTHVRRGASLGAGVVVVCGTTIGEHAFVAAGAVVTRDVPAHALVAGNPGRQVGWVCACGQQLEASLRCDRCRQSYEQTSCGRGLKVQRRAAGPAGHVQGGVG
jgi:UDP-2-acetamido-3-amino-2,3-dideoxy-glucuronate N-acetyltransferase